MGPREAERLSGGVKGCAAPRSGAELHVHGRSPRRKRAGLTPPCAPAECPMLKPRLPRAPRDRHGNTTPCPALSGGLAPAIPAPGSGPQRCARVPGGNPVAPRTAQAAPHGPCARPPAGQFAEALPAKGVAVNDQNVADARHHSAATASAGGVRSTGGSQRLSLRRCSAASAMAAFFMVARFSAASLDTPSRTASRMRSLETRPR
jgi:hypothetical protein